MNLKAFFVDALQSALELGIGTPADVLRHVTPDVLSTHLPRPLWARLLTACLGAPKVDAQLVLETIGVPNLCEHVPASIIWACIADIGTRSIGKQSEEVVPLVAAKASASGRVPLAPPPPEAAPVAPVRASPSAPNPGPAIPAPAKEPLADLISELESETPNAPSPARPRTATSQRFRQSGTGINRPLGTAGVRRPQASASAAPARPAHRRNATEVSETETETAVENGQWASREIAVDDSQLVDWQADSGDDDFTKR